MPKSNTKHQGRMQTFPFGSFHGGFTEQQSDLTMDVNRLSKIMNMKYVKSTDLQGNPVIVLEQRQGTEQVSNTAISSAVKACYYYEYADKYVIATASKLYYLDSNNDPVEIGDLEGVPTFKEYNQLLLIHDGGVTKEWNGDDTTELISSNGGFENGVLSPWIGTINAAADGATEVVSSEKYSGSYSAHVNVVDGGVAVGNISIHYYPTITVDSTKEYCLKLWCKASTPVVPNFRLYDSADWVEIINGTYTTFSVGTSWQLFYYYFTPTRTTTTAKIYLNFGLLAACDVWIDSVSLRPTGFSKVDRYFSEEQLGTGDNIVVDFTGTLENVPVKRGSVSITFTDGTSKTITDDQLGALTGDIDAGGTNTINYETGAYSFRCSGAPDTDDIIYVAYDQFESAPKSKMGFVRASRIYLIGDADNTSRVWYSGIEDHEDYGSGVDEYYFDVDPDDGTSLIAGAVFYDRVVLLKENSIHHMVGFPDDSTHRIQPLMRNIGAVSHRNLVSSGGMLFFLGKEGFMGLHSTDVYGDIQRNTLSDDFQNTAIEYANSSSYAMYNPFDGQIWINLYKADTATDLEYIYVLSVKTGLVTKYKFEFGHSCFDFAGNSVLIGGTDGHLYRLYDTDTRFTDNGVSYSAETYVRGAFSDFGLPFHRKHNKKINLNISAPLGVTANLKLYHNKDYNAFATIPISASAGEASILVDGPRVRIIDLQGVMINQANTDTSFSRKFNWREVMWELTNVLSVMGFQLRGISFDAAIIGD